MDNGFMEKLKNRLDRFEEDIFAGKDIDVKEFYKLKKHLIDTKKDNQDLLAMCALSFSVELQKYKQKSSLVKEGIDTYLNELDKTLSKLVL